MLYIETQISWSGLFDIRYWYLFISVMGHNLLEDFPMPALGRADATNKTFFAQFRDLLFHRSWAEL
jgi:hypothetical protein